jgi:hypothetical protein
MPIDTIIKTAVKFLKENKVTAVFLFNALDDINNYSQLKIENNMKNEKERVTMSNIIDEVIKRCNMVTKTMKANKIFDFAVTGSAALAIEGVIDRMPHDIDLKVSLRTSGTSNEKDISERERIIGILKSWATLFPVENANIDSYKNNGDEKKVFVFKVAGEIPVNVFIVDKLDFFNLPLFRTHGDTEQFQVEAAYSVLVDKMSLNRAKDSKDLIGIISTFSNL